MVANVQTLCTGYETKQIGTESMLVEAGAVLNIL